MTVTEKMLDKAIEQQSQLIKLQFENMWDKLDSIHDEVKKTNGTVREHSRMIQELKETETKHVLNCPQKKDIETINKKLTTIEMMEVGREAVQKFTSNQLTGIGIVAGIVFGFLKFLLDFIVQRCKQY